MHGREASTLCKLPLTVNEEKARPDSFVVYRLVSTIVGKLMNYMDVLMTHGMYDSS